MSSAIGEFNMGDYDSNVKILPGAVVCNECELRGDITIGSLTIVHPRASIIAADGPIVIGEGNLIEEQASIINKRVDGDKGVGQPVLTIGSNNVFEVDSHSEALSIGDNNVLESKCWVGRGVQLSNGCVVGAGCRLEGTEVLPELTAVFGQPAQRRHQTDKPPAQTLQMDFLTKVLPNYHHLRRPNTKAT